MEIQFSFNEKQELIFLNNKPYENEIGSLLMSLIDSEWSVFHLQSEVKTHPLYSYYLSNANSLEDLKDRISDLSNAKAITLQVFETLIDEQKGLYKEKLFEMLLEDEDGKYSLLKKYYSNGIEKAIIMPMNQRNKDIYISANGYHYLFETQDIFTIIVQELKFMLSNNFIVRRCSYCGKFILTRKTNQIYCKRNIQYINKTCNQLGPIKSCQNRRAEPYKLYWKYRTRLFNRKESSVEPDKFKHWLTQTAPYKELAKSNLIPTTELKRILDRIECEVYC